MEMLIRMGILCIALIIGLCIWGVLENVDELIKTADDWEDGE